MCPNTGTSLVYCLVLTVIVTLIKISLSSCLYLHLFTKCHLHWYFHRNLRLSLKTYSTLSFFHLYLFANFNLFVSITRVHLTKPNQWFIFRKKKQPGLTFLSLWPNISYNLKTKVVFQNILNELFDLILQKEIRQKKLALGMVYLPGDWGMGELEKRPQLEQLLVSDSDKEVALLPLNNQVSSSYLRLTI